MKIDIKTNKRLFFRQSLEILKHIPPLNKLRPRELDVLAGFIYYNDMYKDLKEDVRGKVLFDYDTKLNMRDEISMNESTFNTTMSSLRSKGFLTKRSVVSSYGISLNKPEITFNFTIE